MQQLEGAEKFKQEAEQAAENLAAVRRDHAEMEARARAFEQQARRVSDGSARCRRCTAWGAA